MGGVLTRFGLGAVACAALWAAPALGAENNDPALRRLCTGENATNANPCGAAPRPDQAAFRKLVREYGMAFAPKLLAPAETLGINGFDFAFQYALTNINEGEDYWQEGIESTTPPSVLQTLTLDVRKGLPFSFELGAQVSYLIDSELVAVGGSLKWSANEAVEAFPVDLAVRTSLNRIVGSTELDLTTFGLDFIISRGFGVGGVANIAPYMAYSPLFVFAASDVLDSTPRTASDPSASFVFEEEDEVLHRFVIGARFLLGAMNFTPEMAVTKGLQTYSFNLGLEF